jgi:hypothetical protein
LVSLIRTKMGEEFKVAQKIKQRFSDISNSASYYTCYGQYDLLELLMVNSSKALRDLPFHEDIIDYEFSLFYSWEGISQPIHEWTTSFPCLVIVLLKINPWFDKNELFDIEYKVVEYIKGKFAEKANIFAGMGRSEILLLLQGESFENLLSSVSELRQTLKLEDVLGGKDYSDGNMLIFIGSTTFTCIAHPELQGKKAYNNLKGAVKPIVRIICRPGYEKIVAQNKPHSCSGAYNIFGSYDVIFSWDKPIALSQFASELTNCRNEVKKIGGVFGSVTTFMGLEEIIRQGTEDRSAISPPLETKRFVPELIPKTSEMLKEAETLDQQDPMRKAQLLEFLGRLNSYYGRIESKSSFEDMTGIHNSICTLFDELKNTDESNKRTFLLTQLSQMIDLANNALYQRYTGLEMHFESCKHLPLPFLRGISGYITAASYIPSFIFKNVFPEHKIRDAWPGFVLFGLSYSYLLLPGNILSYPADCLDRPVEDWWGITHEVGHAIYRLTRFYQEYLDSGVKDYIRHMANKSEETPLAVDVEEIYASWFDYKYIFAGDKNRYFPMIWKSWLRLHRIWGHKLDYIARSLAIFISSKVEELSEAQNVGIEETNTFIEKNYREMEELIIKGVPEFTDFVKDITVKNSLDVRDYLLGLTGYLSFLEDKYYEKDLYERLNPTYTDELLQEHMHCLEKGQIITDPIPNPNKLLHMLYDRYTALKEEVPLNVSGAVIMTFCLHYSQEYRG